MKQDKNDFNKEKKWTPMYLFPIFIGLVVIATLIIMIVGMNQ